MSDLIQTIGPHVYTLDVAHSREFKEYRCAVCHNSHDAENHVKHLRDCRDRYGHGTQACPACKLEAEAIKATGCTNDPYSLTCGSAWGKGSCGKCGRQPSTD